MATTIESLELQISSQSSEAEKGLRALGDTLRRLGSITKRVSFSQATQQITALNTVINKLNGGKVESLARMGEALRALGSVRISASLPSEIERLTQAAGKVDQATIDKLRALGGALRGLNAPGVAQTAAQATQVANSIGTVIGASGRLQSMLAGLPGIFQRGFSLGINLLHGLGSAAASGAVKVKSLVRSLALLPVKTMQDMTASVMTFSARIRGIVGRLGRLVLMRAIRAALRMVTQGFAEGLKNLYHWSDKINGTVAKSLDNLAANALYLKNSFAAMAAPLINALMPVIDVITEKLVGVINLFNQFVAKLTGASTYTVAQKVATSWDDASDKTKKSVKEIQRTILGFDELNALSKKSDSKNASGSTDYGSMFKTLPIESAIGDFADRIKQMFANQDWRGIGTVIGEKLNTIVNSVAWAGIGAKVGDFINAWFTTKYWTLSTINFTNIGSKIAEFLNNAIGGIDFHTVGAAMVKGMTVVGDMLIGFFTTFDWGRAAGAFSSFVMGCYDELAKWLNSYDWKALGGVIWAKLTDVFNNTDFAGIARSFFTMLGTAFRSAYSLLSGVISGAVGSIKTWFDNSIKGKNWKETALNLLKAIGVGFANIGTWAWNNIIKPFTDALLGPNGLENLWKKVKKSASDIWDGIKTTILNAWNAVKTKASSTWENISSAVVTAWVKVTTWTSSTWNSVKTFVSNTWEGLKTCASEKFNAIRTAVSGAWQNVTTWTSSTWNSVSNTLSSYWNTLKTNAGITFNNIGENISNAWENGKTTLGSFVDWVKTSFSSAWGTAWNEVVTGFGRIFKTIGDKLKAPINAVIRLLNKMINAVETAINKVINGINNRLSFDWTFDVPDWMGGGKYGFAFSPNLRPVDWGNIRELGKGGILTMPTMLTPDVMAGEAGREAVLPLDRNTDWMNDLAARVSARANTVEIQNNYNSDAVIIEKLSQLVKEAQEIRQKNATVEISTAQITAAQARTNRRAGVTVIPIGT